jgi:hypothetical protein
MLIGFVGDVHGRVLHALAAVLTWQEQAGTRLDMIIQVGDLGAYPDRDRQDVRDDPHLAADPSEADFSRLLRAGGRRAAQLNYLRTFLNCPIYFIRGNHDDGARLCTLPITSHSGTAPVDPFDLLHYVPDGTVLRVDALRVGCLGGADPEPGDESAEAHAGIIDPVAHQALMNRGRGEIDVLVTHDWPYGRSVGYYGQVQGSRLITHVVERTRPLFHVAGHLGAHGPQLYEGTLFVGLGDLVASALWHPDACGLQEGCLAVLDTTTSTLRPVTEPWLAAFPTPFRFDPWVEAWTAAHRRTVRWSSDVCEWSP